MRRRQVQIERQGRAGGGRIVAPSVFAEDGRRGSAVAAAVLVFLLRRSGAARQDGGGAARQRGAGRAVAPRLYGAAVAGRGRCSRGSRLRGGGGGGGPAVPRRGGRDAGEVGAGGGPAEGSGGGVVGARGGLGGVEGAEPDRGLPGRVPDLGRVPPRRPPPHPAVLHLRVPRRRRHRRRPRPPHRPPLLLLRARAAPLPPPPLLLLLCRPPPVLGDSAFGHTIYIYNFFYLRRLTPLLKKYNLLDIFYSWSNEQKPHFEMIGCLKDKRNCSFDISNLDYNIGWQKDKQR